MQEPRRTFKRDAGVEARPYQIRCALLIAERPFFQVVCKAKGRMILWRLLLVRNVEEKLLTGQRLVQIVAILLRQRIHPGLFQ